MLSRLNKARSSILSKFTHLDNNDEKKSIDPSNDGSSTPNPAIGESSFQDSQTPITARQLEAYYHSLKLQNEALNEHLSHSIIDTKGQTSASKSDDKVTKNEKTTNSWNNAESTNIEQGGNVVAAKSEVPAEENAIILLDENADSDIELDDYPESLGLPVMLSQPDPLERANLVQLKKMMELEKYRRYRMSYLREHTRHVNRSGINKVSKNIIKQKYRKLGKTLDVDKVPKECQNKSGMFGISLLDTVDDKALETSEKESQTVKPIDDDIAKKLKFPDTRSANANFTMPTKAKSFNAAELKEESTTKTADSNSDKKPTFSFAPAGKPLFGSTATPKNSADKSELSIDEQPSAAFVFNPPSVSKETPSVPVPASKLISEQPKVQTTKLAPTPISTAPSFSFGKTTTPAGTENISKPTFNFGATADFSKKRGTMKASVESIPDEDGLNDESMERLAKRKTPGGFGGSSQTSTISFGFAKPDSSTASTTPLTTSKDSTTVETSKTPSVTSDPNTANPSGFKFGNISSISSSKIPTLNFGASSTDNKKEASSNGSTGKPAFSFGGITSKRGDEERQEKPETPVTTEPISSFGGTGKAETTPLFSSNPAIKSDAPKITFGGFGSDKSAEKPTSLFGATVQDKVADKAIPSLGASTSKEFPSFTSGSSGIAKGSGPTFGAHPTSLGKESGNGDVEKKEETQKQPSLNFGSLFKTAGSAAKTDSTPEISKPAFNFGTNTAVSSFGSTPSASDANDKKPANGSAFGGNAGASSTGMSNFNFGKSVASTDLSSTAKGAQQASTPSSSNASGFNFNAGSSTPTTTGAFSGFNNSGASSTNPKKIEEVKGSFGAPSTGFSFGGNTNPSSAFGNGNGIASTGSKPAFGVSTSDSTAGKSAFGNLGNAGSSGFGFGTGGGVSAFGNSQPSNGISSSDVSGGATNPPPNAKKIFSINHNAFPSLNQVPKPAMGGFGSTGQAPSFNFGGAPATTTAVGFPSTSSAFGNTMNAGNNNGGGNMNAQNGMGMMNNGNIFGGNNNNSGFPAANLNSGGNSSAGNSRSGTPSFNFTGQTGNVDPSAIFQSSQNGTPPPGQPNIMARKRAFPRGMNRSRR